jgi:hypothetical protein
MRYELTNFEWTVIICFSPYLYRVRNLVERFFNRIKQCRRVARDTTHLRQTTLPSSSSQSFGFGYAPMSPRPKYPPCGGSGFCGTAVKAPCRYVDLLLIPDAPFGRLPARCFPAGPHGDMSRTTKSVKMKQCATILFLLGLATTMLSAEAVAQVGRGAASGAIIGGAIGGRRGAAIGAATGAVAGAHRHHRWHNYYWRHGQCWYRARSGRSHPVSHRYCR